MPRGLVRWMVGAVLWWVGAGLPGVAQAEELKVGQKAPAFFLPTYNPQKSGVDRFFLEHQVGPTAKTPRKALVLSFFDIDCKPCRKELPFLQKLHDRYQKDGLGVAVVNCDSDKQKIEEVVKYVTEAGFTFPVLKDRFLVLERKYGVTSFPTLFILDQNQVILDIRVGYNEKEKPFPLDRIQTLLDVPKMKP